MILRFETMMAEQFPTADWQCVDQVECKAGEIDIVIQDHITSPGFCCVEGMLLRVLATDNSYKMFVYHESAFVHTTLHETWMSNESLTRLYGLASDHKIICLRALVQMAKRAIKDSREYIWLNQAMDTVESFIRGDADAEALRRCAHDLSRDACGYTASRHPNVSLMQLANIANLGALLPLSYEDLTAGQNAVILIHVIYRRFHKKKNVAQSEKALCDLLRQEIPFHLVLRSQLSPVIIE